MNLHVIGNVCIDSSFHLPRLPQAGETLNALQSAEGVGGKGANQAVAAARTGAAVQFWSAVGNDAAAGQVLAVLGTDLSTDHLLRLPMPTDRSTILVDCRAENMIVSAVECARAFDPVSMTDIASRWTNGDMVLLQGNLQSPATATCLALARSKGVKTLFNPSPLFDGAAALLAQTDLVIVNRQEALALSGTDDPARAAEQLRALGAGSVIVTLGSDGCLLASETGAPVRHFAADKIVATDTSGAGDCFAGVLAGLLALGRPMDFAISVASRAAALSATRPGTLAAFPTRAEISNFIQQADGDSP